MPNLNICILGKDPAERAAAAQSIGKKGSTDDLGFYHTVYSGKIVSVIDPIAYPAKLSVLVQTLYLADHAMVLAQSPSAELGEIIVALDSLGTVKPVFVTELDLGPLLKGTSLEGSKTFATVAEAKAYLIEQESAAPQGPAEVALDHCFEVKGVGTVALGIVKQGTVNIHDKLQALPLGKEVEVKSIQMNDADVKISGAGGRVGFSLKGTKSEEIPRGTVLVREGWKTGKEWNLSVNVSKFQKVPLATNVFHISAGLQFEPASISTAAEIAPGKNGTLTLSCEKVLALKPCERMLLCNLNAKGLRIIGSLLLA